MLILGINASRKKNGEELRDGSACLIQASIGNIENIVAIQEERLSRRRYDPNSTLAVKYCFPSEEFAKDDIIVGFSSALDPVWTESEVREYLKLEYGLMEVRKIFSVGHHDSHAFEAFSSSTFDCAIIIIIDSMGNQLNADLYGQNSWETQTYYLGKRDTSGEITLSVLKRECVKKPGYGQLFRAVTRYVGFPGYHHASKVMAIAGLAKGQHFRKLSLPHYFDKEELCFSIELDPFDLYSPIQKWLNHHGIPDHPPRNEHWYSSDSYKQNGRQSLRPLDIELASAVQLGYEEFLIHRVRQLVADTGISNVCLGGGCALNCVANSRLVESKVCKNVYVGSAPSDSGQSLGNALYVLNKTAPRLINSFKPPYLGKNHNEFFTVSPLINCQKLPYYRDKINHQISIDLSLGKIIALFTGKSEYGPRALGNRSLIASPDISRFPEMLEKIRIIKKREDYQPFALSIIVDKKCKETLDLFPSPYMSFAPVLNPYLKSIFSAIIHDDGTCRIQTVTEIQNPIFFDIIWNFYIITGIPGLINTSLNLRGEPIVETPDDAKSLWETEQLINGLVINNYYFHRALL